MTYSRSMPDKKQDDPAKFATPGPDATHPSSAERGSDGIGLAGKIRRTIDCMGNLVVLIIYTRVG